MSVWESTAADEEDATGISDWEINNNGGWTTSDTGMFDSYSVGAFQIRVNGEIITTTNAPPTLTSATVAADGESIVLRFSQTVQRTASTTPPASAFTVTADGIALTIPEAPIGLRDNPDALVVHLTRAIGQGQAVVITYTDPTTGNDTRAIQDAAGNDAASFTTGTDGVPAVTNESTVANAPPTVANAIPDQTATAGTAFTYQFPTNTFNDTDTSDTLSYMATKADDTMLPMWLSFDAATRTFLGTPAATDVGTLSVKVAASDGEGGSVSNEFNIEVTAAQPITLVSNVGQAVNLTTSASLGSSRNQEFTTGNNDAGYTLSSIELHLSSGSTATPVSIPTVTLYSGSASGTLVATLPPQSGTVQARRNVTFTASEGISLAKETSYWVVTPQFGVATLHLTSSTVEDATSAPGWSIADQTIGTNVFSYMIRVNGHINSNNNPPVFSADTAARSVAENTAAGQNVGAVLTATDADSDTLIYTLEGTDAASFDIVSASGQIRTKTGVTYNHEAKSTYTVIVKANDSNGGTDTITVTITVSDVTEPPGVPAAPSVSATAGSTTSLDVTWTAPSNTGPAITSYDLQYRQGSSGNFTDGPQNVTVTSAAIGSLAANTSYQVQVRATNAEGDSQWSLAGTGQTTATMATTVPGAPTSLSATSSGSSTINLSWSAPASTGGSAITGYKIEVSSDAGSSWTALVADTASTTTTYEHSGLAAGATRHYRVSAINSIGTSATSSNVANATTDATVPGVPTSLSATASGTSTINLSWSAPASTGGSAITGYKIEVSSDSGSSWNDLVADTASTTTTYEHSGLAAGATRHYRVSAINSIGTSATSSNVANATTDATAPGVPTSLSATASGTSTINLSWSAPASNGGSAITGYKIEVSSDSGSSWNDLQANTAGTNTIHEHRNLAGGTTRHYRVSAINDKGTSLPSNVDDATTDASVPGAPTSLSATASGTSTINLSWTAPASNGGSAITGYLIEVSSDAGSSWNDLVANTGNANTTYAHSGLANGTTRHYRVSAINANGTSLPSNVDDATTGTSLPGAPTSLAATSRRERHDQPLLDRPGQHRRLGHYRLPDRGLLR